MKKISPILLFICICIYSLYFSLYTINRYQKLYMHYYDLGIMHQTVYNSFKAIQTGDFSRILELTNPHDYSADQIKRMAIHNDMLLALLSPFYFIYAGPETLLVLQSVGVAFGAVFVFMISGVVFSEYKYRDFLGLAFSLAYLLYPPLQNANSFEFHAVTFATTFLLAMFYFFLIKRYKWSFVFMILALLSKEEVGLTIAAFGMFILIDRYKHKKIFSFESIFRFMQKILTDISLSYSLIFIVIGIVWVTLSVAVIIPMYRGELHFAAKYYDHIITQPWKIPYYLSRKYVITYIWDLMGPVGLLSLAAPLQLLIAAPEFAINLLSNNANMRDTYFHYQTVIAAFVFISTIYGTKFLANFAESNMKIKKEKAYVIIIGVLLLSTAVSSYTVSSLPYSKQGGPHQWQARNANDDDIIFWKQKLDQDQTRVSTTGHLAPHFTSRQYFYDFSWKYIYADYIVIDPVDAKTGYLKETSAPAYKVLQDDPKYIKIYDKDGIEVYKKITN